MLRLSGERWRFAWGWGFPSVGVALSLNLGAIAATVFLGPSPYFSEADRAFSTNGFLYYFLEDLEDGSANLPGALVNAGWVVSAPGPFTDSVDADDGVVDGSGVGGHSAFSSLTQSNLTVTFDPAVFGSFLPTHAGVVCTDIGAVLVGSPGFGDVTFSARDTNGVLLGSITATNLGNGSALGDSPGATDEDRFFGVIHSGGLSSITLSVNHSLDWEADHVQFGYLALPNAAPRLRIESAGAEAVRLAWSTNDSGFALQETGVLPSSNWTWVTSAPVAVGGEYQVIITPLESNRFYRLGPP